MQTNPPTRTLMDDLILYTDFYQLTMAQGYFLAGKHQQQAGFDYFFRKAPFQGGYAVFAGLGTLLEILEGFTFQKEHLEYLRSQGFQNEFLDYIRGFHFSGNIYAPREGEVVFPGEPILRVEAPLIEAQILETLLLNILNFETLIATKASRMRWVAGENRSLVDFGLRRAQGLGGIHASKAAIIGGFDASSNVFSGYRIGIPVNGTQAHAWVQSFDTELEAFQTFARLFPENTTLLVDTYDTLKLGVPNAIRVAKEMEARGQKMNAIRLDSGDLAYLSIQARQMLDEAGLNYVKIAASNSLDEHTIKSLIAQNARIDVFGVGTRLVTAKGSPALGGVYKLIEIDGQPKVKISNNVEKMTLPGKKHVYRYFDDAGRFQIDGIQLQEEAESPARLVHPHYAHQTKRVGGLGKYELHQTVIEAGKRVIDIPHFTESKQYAAEQLERLPQEHRRFENPHIYKVGITDKLMNLRDELVTRYRGEIYQETEQ